MAIRSRPIGSWAGRALTSLLSALTMLALGAVMAWALIARLEAVPPEPPASAVTLAPGTHDTLELSPQVIAALGVVTAPVKAAMWRDHLELVGSLSVDQNHMVRIRSRFPGEVVAIGNANPSPGAEPRALRMGDRVVKNQLLAVVWSKDIGEKKSDLVDAVSQLSRDELQLKRLQGLDPGIVAMKEVREAQRQRESDLITIDRVERTLRSWKLTQAEIDAVRSEAEKIHNGEPNDIALESHWAEVDVHAPFDGIILERNATLGDIVDTDDDLFKIADLSTLAVMVNAFEENVPDLEALPPDARTWTIRVKAQPSSPGVPGSFETIGKIIDPRQHTTTVMGWVDNRAGRLRIGQFVTASIELPPQSGEVVIPKSALVEESDHAIVFVADGPQCDRVERRTVSVARRSREQIFLYSEPTGAAALAGAKPLAIGELVVTSGVVELAEALRDTLSAMPPDSVDSVPPKSAPPKSTAPSAPAPPKLKQP